MHDIFALLAPLMSKLAILIPVDEQLWSNSLVVRIELPDVKNSHPDFYITNLDVPLTSYKEYFIVYI